MQSQPQTQSSGMSASTIRQIVLVGILIVALAALGYDRKVARPNATKAHDDLQAAMDKQVADKSEPDTGEGPGLSGGPGPSGGADESGDDTTDADSEDRLTRSDLLNQEATEKVLGKSASKITEGTYYDWARYSWMAGVPWRSYDVWVVYIPGPGDTRYCLAVSLNEEPDAQLFDLARKPFSANDLPAAGSGEEYSMTPGLGPGDAGGGPGGGPGAGGPGGGRGGRRGGRGGPGAGGRGAGGPGAGGPGAGGPGAGGPSREDRERPALEDE